ncbi:spindly like TPR repeats [Cryptosporidium sp. chipmunk genotype I]|uniref:spindly like TPR repeats n=1 Tax=Cryptosporidium sp. chipmunk genotype I TaxID=1280935 RepID=UPI00351A8D82|nr:spindly like TPR repeats [Cryptosporidium sp. chipmunk genotype I]
MAKNDGITNEISEIGRNATIFCFCNDPKLNSSVNFKEWVVKGIKEHLFKEDHINTVGTILIELLNNVESFRQMCINLRSYTCNYCLSRLSETQKFEESDMKDLVYFIGMTFSKIQLQTSNIKLVNLDKIISLLVEMIQNCIRYKMINIDSINNDEDPARSSEGDNQLIMQVLSFGIIQISLKNYDDAYLALNYIANKYPDIDRLVNCLKDTVLILFKSNEPESLGNKSHQYFLRCFLSYPNIILCMVKTILSLNGIDLCQPPLLSIKINDSKNLEVYFKCKNLLQECFESYNNCVNCEIGYTLSRLYFEIDGNTDKSISIVEKLLEKNPFNDEFRFYLGKLLYHKAIEARKSNAEFSLVKSILKKVILYIPQSSEVYNDLGVVYYELGKEEKAIWCLKLSIHFNPMNINAYDSFGIILRRLGFIDQAILCYERISKINPNCINTLNIIAALYGNIGKIDESFEYFKKCLEVNQSVPDVYNNLGVLYRDCGNFLMAKNCFLVALELEPNHTMAFQNLLYILNYFIPLDNPKLIGNIKNNSIKSITNNLKHSKSLCLEINSNPDSYVCEPRIWINNSDYYVNYQDMYDLSLEWGKRFIKTHKETKDRLDKLIPVTEIPDIESNSCTELINIGFVGAEYFHHAVAFFILAPIKFLSENFSKESPRNCNIECGSRIKLNIFIYDNSPRHDYYSSFFKELVPIENWRYIHGKDIEYTSKLIRADKIHILFDLSGHTVNNCLTLFALKNSPIQISWIGYPNTTGLKYIDYRITDKIVDPVHTKQKYSEKLLYLPNCFLCYTLPKIQHPPICELPLKKNGFITFGSFNRVTKLHPLTIDLWGEVLKNVPESHLLLKSKAFSSQSCCNFYLEIFKSKYNIQPHRISLIPLSSSYYSHLELYNDIDISLDTFPYAGTTTTFECIFMGVPLITLSIDQSENSQVDSSDIYTEISSFHSQNVGKSILTNLNLRELIASNKKDFIRAASNLANDTERLIYYRSNLRRILSESKLCDGEKFSRDFFELILHTLTCHKKNLSA